MSLRCTPTFSDRYELLLSALMAQQGYHLGPTAKVREIVQNYLDSLEAKGEISLSSDDFNLLEIKSFKEILLRFTDVLLEDSYAKDILPALLRGKVPTPQDINNIAYVLCFNNIKVSREYLARLANLTSSLNVDIIGDTLENLEMEPTNNEQ